MKSLVTILALAMFSLLSGCVHNQPQVITETKVATPVARKVPMPEKPIFPLQLAKKEESLESKLKKAVAEIELRKSYELKLETAVTACNADSASTSSSLDP